MARRFEEHLITLEQYLTLERQDQSKHEYFQGRIYLMAGGSPNHSLIAGNLVRLLGNLLEEQACRVYNSDLQILVRSKELVTYPDVSVVCGEVEYAREDPNLVTNPLLIGEVLSPSTASYDQTTKFNLYKELDSFEEYLLVDSRNINVIYFHKLGPNQWVQQIYSERNEVVFLSSLKIEISLAQIYAKVEFDVKPLPLR